MPSLEPTSHRIGRTYQWDDESFWSVTTVLNVLNKPALPNWAAKSVSQYVIDNMPLLVSLCGEGREAEALDLMKGSPWRQRDKAANLGTAVHKAVEDYCVNLETPIPDDATAPFLDHFRTFLAKYQPVIIENEATVFNRRFNYAGTLDLILEYGDSRWVVDIKSGSGVYPEFALQVSAYANAEFIGRHNGEEAQMPTIDRGAILHLRPNGFRFVPVRIDEPVFRSFLHIREAFRWNETLADTAVMAEVRM